MPDPPSRNASPSPAAAAAGGSAPGKEPDPPKEPDPSRARSRPHPLGQPPRLAAAGQRQGVGGGPSNKPDPTSRNVLLSLLLEAEQLTFGDQAQRLRPAQPELAGRLRSHRAVTQRLVSKVSSAPGTALVLPVPHQWPRVELCRIRLQPFGGCGVSRVSI